MRQHQVLEIEPHWRPTILWGKQINILSEHLLSLSSAQFEIWTSNLGDKLLHASIGSPSTLSLLMLVQPRAFCSPRESLVFRQAGCPFHTEPETDHWKKVNSEAAAAWLGAAPHILPISWKSFLTISIPLIMNHQMSRAPAGRLIKTIQDFVVCAKKKIGSLGPWKAAIRIFFHSGSLVLKLDSGRKWRRVWGKKLLKYLPVFSLPHLLCHHSGSPGLAWGNPSHRKHPRKSREAGETIAAEIAFAVLNFLVPQLAVQILTHFPP